MKKTIIIFLSVLTLLSIIIGVKYLLLKRTKEIPYCNLTQFGTAFYYIYCDISYKGKRSTATARIISRGATVSPATARTLHNATARILSRGAPAGPVEEGLLFRPEDYVYSSARDYNRERGLLDHVIVVDLY